MSHILKKLLTVLIIAILFLGVYIYINRSTGVGDTATSKDVDITNRTNQIVNDTKEVDSYALDTDIFSDARFNSLNDFGIDIPDVRTGRTNPFLPVE